MCGWESAPANDLLFPLKCTLGPLIWYVGGSSSPVTEIRQIINTTVMQIPCWVVSVLIYAVTASTSSPQSGAAVPHPTATANYVVHKLSFASHFTYLTNYEAPHRSMDVGGAPSLSLKCESWLLKPIWEFNSLFTHLWRGSTPMAQKISEFISYIL